MKKEIEKGDKFGRLTVIKEVDSVKKARMYECACECGNVAYVDKDGLRYRKTKSCGCLRSEIQRKRQTKHGHTGKCGKFMSGTYVSWLKMRQRCNNPNAFRAIPDINYPKKWDDFEVFLEEMGEKPEGKMFVRIDQEKDYSLNNCAYADWEELKVLKKKL